MKKGEKYGAGVYIRDVRGREFASSWWINLHEFVSSCKVKGGLLEGDDFWNDIKDTKGTLNTYFFAALWVRLDISKVIFLSIV